VNRDSERSIESLSLALVSSHLAALASHSGIEFKILRDPRTNRQRSAVSRHDPLELLVVGVQGFEIPLSAAVRTLPDQSHCPFAGRPPD
jgi:hypothetical protein